MYDAMEIDDTGGPPMPTPKATPVLRGRKRFVADRDELKATVAANGLETSGLKLKGFRPGDEEGSVEFRVLKDGKGLTTLSLQVTETSSYPNDHSYICYALEDISPELLTVVEDIGSFPAKPLQDTLTRILKRFARALGGDDDEDEPESQAIDEDDSGSEAGVEGYDFDQLEYGAHGRGSEDPKVLAALKRDFLEVVGAGFNPGILKFGTDDFVLTTAMPVTKLNVPVRALVAWDRRLLSTSRHIVLMMSGMQARWPAISADGTVLGGANIHFHVGLSKNYKPSTASVVHAVRTFALRDDELEAEPEVEPEPFDPDMDPWEAEQRAQQRERERIAALPVDENAFEKFSLSSSLDSLLDHKLLPLIKLRLQYELGWAGAEMLLTLSEKYQKKPEDVSRNYGAHLLQADEEERVMARKYNLPPDPILGRQDTGHLNLQLIAMCYLLRRLAMCTRYCLVCHTKVDAVYEALKPYVCSDKLCTYQYYSLNFGPSIEYEVESNTEVVDLLVSLTYVSCFEGQLVQGLPIGMGLRCPRPANGIKGTAVPQLYGVSGQPAVPDPAASLPTPMPTPGSDGMVDFDSLPVDYQRAAIVQLLDQLPAVADMKKYLDKARGKGKVRLSKMKPDVPIAAWSLLRWSVASSTAYLEEIEDEDDMVHNIDKTWRQFRFSVGAPDAEAKFKTNITSASSADSNAAKFPSLFAFHGSPLRNWHSIIREGLQVRPPIHGRAYGNGVYFAKDGSVSMGHYAQRGSSKWKNSAMCPTSCVALAEIVNLPKQFVSSNPYFVVADPTWIITRYLLVATAGYSPTTYGLPPQPDTSKATSRPAQHWVPLDPAHPLTLNTKPIQIPEQQQKLQRLLDQRRADQQELEYDEVDSAVFAAGDLELSDRAAAAAAAPPPPPAVHRGPDWVHNEAWVNPTSYRLLPPPSDAMNTATLAVQRELRGLLKEQQSAKRLDDLGWYMPDSLISDNLFQWMVEMHSFDPDLPLAKDMKDKGVNSLLFEIRFPPAFPISPPFFRLVKPRLLPFLQGGGGHITAGGSICMDLLVADGWLPSYNVAAILLQIKMAISSLDPRPARLASNWQASYDVGEALEGFKRAARTHGWTVPDGTERLVRY